MISDDISLKCNSNQYSVGIQDAKDIDDAMDSYKEKIANVFKDVKSVAEDYKIELEDSIDMSDIEAKFNLYDGYISDISSTAKKMITLAENYSNDPTEENKNNFLDCYASYFKNSISNEKNKRLLATIGMGAFKFGEGFLEFFEDFGDGAIVLGSGVVSLFGGKEGKKLSKKWREFAEEDLSVDLVEKNKAFETINEYSYFDKDSVYADVFKFGGKAAAAVVTGKVASRAFGGITNAAAKSSKFGKVAKVAEKAGEHSNSIVNSTNNFASKTRDNLSKGYGLKKSTLYAATGVAIDALVDKGSSKLGTVIASHDRVKEVVKGADTLATNLFKENKAVAKKAAEKAVDFSASGVEKKTELEDETADEEKNRGINAAKKTTKTVAKKAIEDAL